MKRRDFWVFTAIMGLVLVLLILGRALKPAPVEKARPTLSVTLAGEEVSGQPEAANSYLRIKQGEAYYHLVPLNKPGEIVIHQEHGQENVIHIDKDSVVMHAANCPNHDCVRMGRMTLQNIETRVNQRWITCLPHQLSLELIPGDEAQRLMEGL
ncbi:MAG: hypothetical protein GXY84_01225 [Clostridiales bacterium]|nr:hypothetical protein [Clostridiales bacterium]